MLLLFAVWMQVVEMLQVTMICAALPLRAEEFRYMY